MSSSKADATLFLDDTEEILRKKIMTLCLSGADPDPEVHKKKGGNVDMDIAYQYLKYFEYDDKRLEEIKEGFTKGTISAVEIKEILVQSLYKIMKQIQDYRKTIDDKLIEDFYAQKPMDLPKPKMKEPTKEESKLYEYLVQLKIQHTTKYHVAIITKDQAEDLARMLEGTICKGILLKSKEGYIYYIINEQTTVNPKTLSKKIGAKNLKFAESDTYCFKLYVNDLGLLGAMAQTPASEILVGNSAFSSYKGSFTEQFENASYQEILKVKNELVSDISKFEHDYDRKDPDWNICPKPDVCYQWSLEALGLIAPMLAEAFNREYERGEKGMEDYGEEMREVFNSLLLQDLYLVIILRLLGNFFEILRIVSMLLL